MIKRYTLVLVEQGYMGHKVRAMPSPTGELVMHDDYLTECERRVTEEREKWQTEVQRLHASIEILDSMPHVERIRAEERERGDEAIRLLRETYNNLVAFAAEKSGMWESAVKRESPLAQEIEAFLQADAIRSKE